MRSGLDNKSSHFSKLKALCSTARHCHLLRMPRAASLQLIVEEHKDDGNVERPEGCFRPPLVSTSYAFLLCYCKKSAIVIGPFVSFFVLWMIVKEVKGLTHL